MHMREHERDDKNMASHEQEQDTRAPEHETHGKDSSRAEVDVQRAAIAAAGGNAHSLGPGGLQTLQRLAGNAGVTGAIQQRNHHAVERNGTDREDQNGGSRTGGNQSGEHEDDTNAAGAAKVQQVIASGGGSKIPEETRRQMERSFGADFSNVRIHSDSAAKASAQSVRAKALTVGDNIVLGPGLSLESAEGKRTLAHELTHVIQQRHGPVAGSSIGGGVNMSSPSDHFEHEAEANADRVMDGKHAQVPTAGHDGKAKAAKGHSKSRGRP